MKRLISVSAFEFSTKWPSSTYISNHSDYYIRCNVVSKDMGVFKDKYLLELEGSVENIQNFLEYLKYEGFKIK